LAETAGILFFLLGAMTIVELVDAFEGFRLITTRINAQSKLKLMWIVAFVTFFMSSVLDNLTTTIVMISLLRKFNAVHRLDLNRRIGIELPPIDEACTRPRRRAPRHRTQTTTRWCRTAPRGGRCRRIRKGGRRR
jgi:hypothetical protein